MDTDENLALHLLARAGALPKNPSAVALLSNGRSTSDRVDAVRGALSDAERLIGATAAIV